MDNNTAERAMRSVVIGRKNYLFVGSQTGGKAAAIAYTLIETAKLNGVELPGLAAIADGPGTPRYFSSISDHVLGHETWGMIAAVLGNSVNRFAFFDAFWRD